MTKHHLQARAAVLIVASALLVPTEAWAGSWYWSKDGTSPPCTDGTAKGVTGDGAWIGCSESNGGYKVWEEIGDPMNPWGGPYLENAIQIASDASYKDWVAGSGGKVKWFSGTSSWTEWLELELGAHGATHSALKDPPGPVGVSRTRGRAHLLGKMCRRGSSSSTYPVTVIDRASSFPVLVPRAT